MAVFFCPLAVLDVSQALREGLIEHPLSFRIAAIVSGDWHKLKAGEYVGMTPDGPRGPRMRASDGVAAVARLKISPTGHSCVAGPRRGIAVLALAGMSRQRFYKPCCGMDRRAARWRILPWQRGREGIRRRTSF